MAVVALHEESRINEIPEHRVPVTPRKVVDDVGAVVAVLLGIPSFFIGLFGAAGVLTGQKLIAGFLGAMWGYLAVTGAYELNRRKFQWRSGERYADLHLLGGTIAASSGLMMSGALHETMPVIALAPALSAILRAGDGHRSNCLSLMHGAILAAGLGVGIWFYDDGVVGGVLLARIAALP